jgi:hypothetical protein
MPAPALRAAGIIPEYSETVKHNITNAVGGHYKFLL